MLGVLTTQIVQQPSAVTNQFQQPSPGMIILGVRLEMFGQAVNSLSKECNLNLG